MKPENDNLPAPRAVALKWEGVGAPRVTAKGEGDVAQQIIQLAAEYGIPLQEDEALIALLSHIELDQEIPHALYVAVAEILAFAYRLAGRVSLSETRSV